MRIFLKVYVYNFEFFCFHIDNTAKNVSLSIISNTFIARVIVWQIRESPAVSSLRFPLQLTANTPRLLKTTRRIVVYSITLYSIFNPVEGTFKHTYKRETTLEIPNRVG